MQSAYSTTFKSKKKFGLTPRAVVFNSSRILRSNFYRNMPNRCQQLSAFKPLKNIIFGKGALKKRISRHYSPLFILWN